jgi:ankyrin repeat protein
LDALQHCFPPNLRQYLNELPETLDETYDRILKGINKAQKDNAHRLLQCLSVAVRPLLVEELAELLVFDFSVSSGGIPTLKEDWRWDDEEEAILSTCSSLIAIIPRGDHQVVQFSHFSVKEYLTSPRLAQSPHGDVSQFSIDLERAHTVMAQACLATLLQLDEHAGNCGAKASPLVNYAAQHWVDHAQFEKVAPRVRDGMDDLFNRSKPHFATWLRVHDIDKNWNNFSAWSRDGVGSPLYYAAFCGFYDLAECLIMEHPYQVNARGGLNLFPLPAALSKRHLHVANLLYQHGAVVDVQGDDERTPLSVASFYGHVDIMRWLLDHGADANARSVYGFTPLHEAACAMRLEAVQVLLERNADINSQCLGGETPLHGAIIRSSLSEGNVVAIVGRLLEHGADPNMCDDKYKTPLHHASSHGILDTARLLLSYGAKVDEKDKWSRTPFQLATSNGHNKLAKLLLELGANFVDSDLALCRGVVPTVSGEDL